MTKDEALHLALEAMNLANSSHDTMLLSDPPQSAWRYHNVDMKLREAIIAIKAALEANEFNPDWDTQAVLTEEIQRMAKRIEELEAQRTWVGLTDEEIFDVWLSETPAPDKVFYQKLCRSIEAKLMSKNYD